MQNKNDKNTVKYVISKDTGFRNIFTMTFFQKNRSNNEMSGTMTFDIAVCGAETIIDNTSGSSFSKIWTTPASSNEIIERTATIEPLFTVDNSGADTHTNCVFAVFETFMDSTCLIAVNDPKLTHFTTENDVFMALNLAAVNKLEVDTTSPFSIKTLYIKATTTGRVS